MSDTVNYKDYGDLLKSMTKGWGCYPNVTKRPVTEHTMRRGKQQQKRFARAAGFID